MSFENTNILLDKIILLLETKKNYKDINYFELNNLKQEIFNDFIKKYNDINFEVIDNIINLLYKNNYTYNKNICFTNGNNCIRGYDHLFIDINVPKKYKNLEIQFNKLKNLPQPAQRTKEWYDYRHNRITASDTATAIDLNPYEPVENFIIKKCDPNFPFYDNVNVAHGKKYEPVATMIYEHIYNNRVYEFGALPSEKYNFVLRIIHYNHRTMNAKKIISESNVDISTLENLRKEKLKIVNQKLTQVICVIWLQDLVKY